MERAERTFKPDSIAALKETAAREFGIQLFYASGHHQVEVFSLLLKPSLETGPHNVTTQHTAFGWILSGPTAKPQSHVAENYGEARSA